MDDDISIVAEDIPVGRNHALLSKYKFKTENVYNCSPNVIPSISVKGKVNDKVFLNSQNKQTVNAACKSTTLTMRPRGTLVVAQTNCQPIPPSCIKNVVAIIKPKLSQPGNNDQNKYDISLPTVRDITTFIEGRTGVSNMSDLKRIPSVDLYELLKSSASECFSRKGLHSCAACSSIFTSPNMYHFHLERCVGDFSYDCDHCAKTIKTSNPCQIYMHMIANHKGTSLNENKVTHKSFLSLEDSNEKVDVDVSQSSKNRIVRLIESYLSEWNVDIFDPYQRRTKDHRYILLPLARKDVMQSHKFYSDHYRAASNKLCDRPVELLHCFMCDFVCGSHNELIAHLQGDWPNTVSKCAFCNLSIPVNKESLCSAKAHVLLHMGIFMMCPRCGFVPPSDLSPEDFEVTLRLHLRFVCFHFHLMQIFLCPQCGDTNSKAFNSANQVISHIYDEHLTEKRYCSICRSVTDTTTGVSFNLMEFSSHLISVHNRNDDARLWKDGVVAGKKCPECPDLISQKESFFSHSTVRHKAQLLKGKCAFRCFGTCKRIHQSIDEFQSHRSECAECVNVKNKLYQPHLLTPEATSLCFCLYCGIGVRRKRLANGVTETHSEPQTFASLHDTHVHEQDHLVCETDVTACPWCPNRMSAKVNEMTEHMRTHVPGNWFLSWYTRRSDCFTNRSPEVMYCYCFAAIDNPLSLHYHAIPQLLSTSSKHVALTDSIHREYVTTNRHSISGDCPLCANSFTATDSLEMTWHIFCKHRNTLCYVCKNYRILNADNSAKCRVTMWNHVYLCLRLHTPRLNMRTGIELLQNIATCATMMSNCTEIDFSRVDEVSASSINDQTVPHDDDGCSSSTENSIWQNSERKYECGYCKETAAQSKRFSTRLMVNEHLKIFHGLRSDSSDNGLEYLCFVCGLKFDSVDKWEDHILTEHDKGFRSIGFSMLDPESIVLDSTCTTYRCYLCNHRFEKRSGCEDHMMALHNIEHSDLNWGMLSDSSASSDAIKRSKLSINSSKTCLLTYPCKKLKVERERSSSESLFTCGVCPLQCSTRQEMITHALSMHLQSSKRSLNSDHCYLCPDCSLSFLSRKSRSIHLKLVHKVDNPAKFMASLISM